MQKNNKIMSTINTSVKGRADISEKRRMYALEKKKRIPVSKIYWKKGDYKELVEDPFNLN